MYTYCGDVLIDMIHLFNINNAKYLKFKKTIKRIHKIDPNKKIPPITELMKYKNGVKNMIPTIIQQK